MGSFSSKMRQSTPENTGNSTKMSEPEASPGEAAARERTTGRTDVTNGEKAKIGNIHQEKPKVVQSFGWLVETPVILHTTAKEIKDKGKKPAEDPKGKSISVATYSYGKYLKMAELALPTSSGATKPISSIYRSLTPLHPARQTANTGAISSQVAAREIRVKIR